MSTKDSNQKKIISLHISEECQKKINKDVENYIEKKTCNIPEKKINKTKIHLNLIKKKL